MDAKKWELTPEESDELKGLIKTAMDAAGETLVDKTIPDCFFETMDPIIGMACLSILYEKSGPDSPVFGRVIQFVENNLFGFSDSDLARFVELMLKRGIGDRSVCCATELGASYYMGGVVAQNYGNAAELYEIASGWGGYQATVSLGYIYEYGRTGERDLMRAFVWYALASTMTEHCSEALYKMGDCYSRGMLPSGPNLDIAHRLWRRSYDAALDAEERAQPAIRLAPLFIDAKRPVESVDYDPLFALRLYQVAEIGLRVSIQNGLVYYEKRLKEAIAGQARARELLDTCIELDRLDGGHTSQGEFGLVVK